MKGLELCERFYLEYGAPMLEREFGSVTPLCAAGLVGAGSECFGYDDELSHDHDFEPGFCIFLPDEDVVDRRTAFELERAYSRLPNEFMGYKRENLAPVGGQRHGVIRMSEFFRDKTGKEDGELTLYDWIYVPEQSLSEAVNGKVFYDGHGAFTKIRERLSYMPEDARLKKLASNLLIMGQAGQYNYPRCIARGETGAAQLAVTEFVKSAMHVIFLLNKRYMPYYKWSFRALYELDVASDAHEKLEYLISSANAESEARRKRALIEELCATVAAELRSQGLTFGTSNNEMECCAYEVNERIRDAELRNMHILAAL